MDTTTIDTTHDPRPEPAPRPAEDRSSARDRALAARMLAHDIATPMSTLGLALDELRGGRRRPDDTLRVAEASYRRACAMLHQLEAILRGEAAEARGDEDVDLSSVVAESVAAAAFGAARVRPFRAGGPAVHVRGDRKQLRRAIDNLLRNARQHARSRVWAELEGSAARVRVRVFDDGPGLGKVDPEVAFELGCSGAGGTGVGLAMVRWVARAHGGRAFFDLEARATCVVLELPARRQDRGPPQAKEFLGA
ncbi:MAG: sensor histidine kinase [Sandaracinaceae bacterium]